MHQTVVITGANRGIGLALCRTFQKNGFDVIAICRKSSPELTAINCRIEEGIDMMDQASIAKLAHRLQGVKIAILINNAGMMEMQEFDEITQDCIMKQMQVNALAPLFVTKTLRQCLHEGSKVIMISSRAGSIASNEKGGNYGYRASKAALNALSKSLANDLRAEKIGVFCLHPGFVKTDMTTVFVSGEKISIEQSADDLYKTIGELSLDKTGTFHHATGHILPW